MKTFVLTVLCNLLIISQVLHAQEKSELETMEVTAQYRVENVQDVPIPLSSLSGELVSKLDIDNAGDLSRLIPGMTLADFAPGQALISMRGIVSADDGAGMDNSVVVFLDGVYVGRLANINFDLFDIQRIEVLRGPQGTLAGRNAIGGSINIITQKPSDEALVNVSAALGNYNIVRTSAAMSGAVIDNIAGRFSISNRSRDGFVRNILLDEDNQTEDVESVRAQLSYDSAFGIWNVSFDYTSDDRNDMGRTPIVNGNFDYIGVWRELGGEPFQSASPISGFSKRRLKGASITGTSQLPLGELTTILGWRNSLSDWEMATVGAPLGGNYDLSAGIFGADVNDDIYEDINQHSMELRWQDERASIRYTVGVFFLHEDTERVEQYKLDFNSVASGQVTLGNEVSEQFNQTNSLALYAQMQWFFLPDWSVSFGGRLTQDRKQSQFVTLNCAQTELNLVARSARCQSKAGSLNILQQSFDVTVDETWHDFSPRLALQYSVSDDTMVYGSVGEGFKSGGFPGSPGLESVARQAVKPEQAVNYELGIKSDLGSKLRVNASLFYTDYKDLQVGWFGPSEANPGFGSFVTTNIDDATIKGGEIEFTWVASDIVSFTGNYAYLDTNIDNFVLSTFAGQLDLSGSRLRQSPEHKAYLATDVSYPLSRNRGVISLNASYQFTDEQISDYINQNVTLEANEVVNARLAWMPADEAFEIAIWAQNLLDEEYVSHAYVIGPGIIGIWGEPRTVGVTISAKFE